jgi:hypothetical protein
MTALKQLIALERPTTKAAAYSEWPSPPKVIIECDEAEKFWSENDTKINISV